jgi:hypothetical protein
MWPGALPTSLEIWQFTPTRLTRLGSEYYRLFTSGTRKLFCDEEKSWQKGGLSTRHHLAQITSVFHTEPSSGLTSGILRRSRRVGLWIVASDAIASDGITDVALPARRFERAKLNRVKLKRRDAGGGVLACSDIAGRHARQVVSFRGKRPL